MGAMFEDHSKVTDEEVKDAKEQAIKSNLGVEELDVGNMSDEELDVLLANSDSVNRKVEAIIHHFEKDGEQKIVEDFLRRALINSKISLYCSSVGFRSSHSSKISSLGLTYLLNTFL